MRLDIITFDTCIVCDGLSIKGKTHIACQNQFTPDSYISFFNYNKTARQIILKSKYGQKSYTLIDSLINLDANLLKINSLGNVDIIVPVPMTKSIKKIKDMNHAMYIAYKIGRILKTPTIDILSKDSRLSQKSLSGEYRKYHLKGKIKIKHELINKIKNKSILLVDDVLTTGATMIESTKVLKLNGTKSVKCLTLTKDEFNNV